MPALTARAQQLDLPVENLLTPEIVRRLVWDPQGSTHGDPSAAGIAAFLRGNGARDWQVQQTAELLEAAIRGS